MVVRIDIDNLRFSYGRGRPVIDGLSLTYESPDVLCILGSNGAGKSTLLQCVVGALEPAGGTVRIDGRPVGSYAPRDLARRMAYIPQAHAPTFEYPVVDVVAMGRTSAIGRFSSPGAADEAAALEKLDFLGIAHLSAEPYTRISGGERQLVMIASALAQEPEALVLDEPTAHLDFGNQHRFLKLVEQLRAQGMGVIMTTHFPDHALSLGGSTAIMDGGVVSHAGPAHEVVTSASMRALYGIEASIESVGGRRVCIPGPVKGP
ncbi:ABC transporter ATP-binding protein [Paraeggerthella sp. Marseille-Q4926]|uniref:ABC transporter ATP-binding protein n=1 Tax=Paraeggerthella sp. Marseille-Q4926 TaxID=2866587 RepID=UPI001CE43E43|nr:ABC transporter ATP-binding protein [Paraeggerthella sp. Marseille-Q4926]